MLPRSARKVSNVAVTHLSHQTSFANATVLSTFSHNTKMGAIHTKKQQKHKSPGINSNQPHRWFSSMAASIPSLQTMAHPAMTTAMERISSAASTLSPLKMTEKLGVFVGNAAMANQNSRVMQRVWARRQKKLAKATNAVMDVFRSEALQFHSTEIYVRTAGMFDDNEDNDQRQVHIALKGIAHTVVVLRSDHGTYLLDRVVEGIRLTELSLDTETGDVVECPQFKPQEMLRLATHRNIDLSGGDVADWIEAEGKREYNVITNSCVNFSYYFHQHFLRGLKTRQFVDSFKASFFGAQSEQSER